MAEQVILTHSRRLEIAYLNVLGAGEGRTPDQAIVWQDIEGFCYAHRLVTEKDDEHRIDPESPHFFDGRRSVWLRMRGQIIKAQMEPRKPILSRKRKQKSNP